MPQSSWYLHNMKREPALFDSSLWKTHMMSYLFCFESYPSKLTCLEYSKSMDIWVKILNCQTFAHPLCFSRTVLKCSFLFITSCWITIPDSRNFQLSFEIHRGGREKKNRHNKCCKQGMFSANTSSPKLQHSIFHIVVVLAHIANVTCKACGGEKMQ